MVLIFTDRKNLLSRTVFGLARVQKQRPPEGGLVRTIAGLRDFSLAAANGAFGHHIRAALAEPGLKLIPARAVVGIERLIEI
jgi:hypothetical protein